MPGLSPNDSENHPALEKDGKDNANTYLTEDTKPQPSETGQRPAAVDEDATEKKRRKAAEYGRMWRAKRNAKIAAGDEEAIAKRKRYNELQRKSRQAKSSGHEKKVRRRKEGITTVGEFDAVDDEQMVGSDEEKMVTRTTMMTVKQEESEITALEIAARPKEVAKPPPKPQDGSLSPQPKVWSRNGIDAELDRAESEQALAKEEADIQQKLTFMDSERQILYLRLKLVRMRRVRTSG